jgi:prolyl oligopeptidase PreP (S9A serine peptidase family)
MPSWPPQKRNWAGSEALLIGGAITERPYLFGAALLEVGFTLIFPYRGFD